MAVLALRYIGELRAFEQRFSTEIMATRVAEVYDHVLGR